MAVVTLLSPKGDARGEPSHGGAQGGTQDQEHRIEPSSLAVRARRDMGGNSHGGTWCDEAHSLMGGGSIEGGAAGHCRTWPAVESSGGDERDSSVISSSNQERPVL